jgi:hypothetical protein
MGPRNNEVVGNAVMNGQFYVKGSYLKVCFPGYLLTLICFNVLRPYN